VISTIEKVVNIVSAPSPKTKKMAGGSYVDPVMMEASYCHVT